MSTSRLLQAAGVWVSAGVNEAPQLITPGWIAIEDGIVADLGVGARAGAGAIDLGGLILAPGYVDVHVHGGDGLQVNGDTPAAVAESVAGIARFHARHGTTAMIATTVADSSERLAATVQGAASLAGSPTGGARVLGVHLEGPWIARAKLGAQDPAAVRAPDASELRELAALAPGCLLMVTVAPELPGADKLLAVARELGIVVAIGHTNADFATVVAAIESGARHATHLFNAMAPLHHRRPGPVAALLLDDRVTVEVIPDLEHLHPAVLQLVLRLAPGRVVAVSDAVMAAGLADGCYHLGNLEVTVAGGRVTLASDGRTLAGSVLTMDVAVRNLHRTIGLGLGEALLAATGTPARAAGLDSLGIGRLSPGSLADVVVLDDDLGVAATLVGGEVVHDPAGLFS